MHSFGGLKAVVAACAFGQVSGAALPTPAITPAPPSPQARDHGLQGRQFDPISLAQVLLTALPLSLRLVAATNVPAVSSMLWSEFLDDKKPEWFLDLPWDVQSYLIIEFGPETAWPTAPSSVSVSTASATTSIEPSATSTVPEQVSSTALGSSTVAIESESPNIVSSSTASSSESFLGSTSQTTTSQRSSALSSTGTSGSIPNSSATAVSEAPIVNDSGLSTTQKIGIGVGVPVGLLTMAAFLIACCLLSRRRRTRHVNDNEAPSSPGFIPRFSFQDRGVHEHHEHRAPLNPVFNSASHDMADTNWEDDDYEHAAIAASHRRDTFPPAAAQTPMAMQDTAPIMAPVLFHTHSSNRARGTRTSYSSLHAVAEVAEPEDDMLESPILGRRQTRTGPRRPSLPTSSRGTIKRKPVPTSPRQSPAADMASQSLLRPALAPAVGNHSGSSSSGLAVSSMSSNSGLSYESESPISPMTHQTPQNPFAGGYDYLEDYGPEYSHSGYLDGKDGAYGGHCGLDSYSEVPPLRGSSKTEWPLRNATGSGHGRNRSPMWDRVYER